MARRADAALAVDLGADRLGDVVQQGRRAQHCACGWRERLPGRQRRKRFGDHARVDQHIALGVVVRILGRARQIVQPGYCASSASQSSDQSGGAGQPGSDQGGDVV